MKPFILAAAEEILSLEAAQKLEGVPILNDLVQRRIIDLVMEIDE